MSDSPAAAWYHCAECGELFRGESVGGTGEVCPACGQDPTGAEGNGAAPVEEAAPRKVRRKVRRPKTTTPSASSAKRRRGSRRKARLLAVFVVVWCVLLTSAAIFLGKDREEEPYEDEEAAAQLTPQQLDDAQLIQDQRQKLGRRVQAYLAATDLSGRVPHVVRGEKLLLEMAAAARNEPVFPNVEPISAYAQEVLHTPAGRAIDTMWSQADGSLYQAVFFEDQGEWKLDWHAFTRANTTPWTLFLTEKGDAEGSFRVLARERVGAAGRNDEWIGLVLYVVRGGAPAQPVNPSPEIRVNRESPEGRAIQQAFDDRANGIGAFGSTMVTHDPDGMIRLHAALSRKGEEEREFRLDRLIATHWLELPEAPAAE